MTEQSLKPKAFDGGAQWIWSQEGVRLPGSEAKEFPAGGEIQMESPL